MNSISKNTKTSNCKEIDDKKALSTHFGIYEDIETATNNASVSTCLKSGHITKSRTNSSTDDSDLEKLKTSYKKYIQEDSQNNLQKYLRLLSNGLFLSKPNIKKIPNELKTSEKYHGANFDLLISIYSQFSNLIKGNYDQDKTSSIFSKNLIATIKDILEMFLNYLITVFADLKNYTKNYSITNFKKSNDQKMEDEQLKNLKNNLLLQKDKVDEFRNQLGFFLIFMEDKFSHVSPKNKYDEFRKIMEEVPNFKPKSENVWLKKPISEYKMLEILNEFFGLIIIK